MPRVSVVCPTMRVGGLDVLCNGLEGQSFKDFELVLSDGVYGRRREIVAEKAKNFSFPITHVEPFENPFPLNSFCRYANTALAHASGEIVLFVTDYTWLNPGCVARHVEQQDGCRKGRGLMCPHEYAQAPDISENFPRYEREETDKYEQDVKSGKLDDVMWSIFAEEFNGDASLLPKDSMAGSDPKLTHQVGPISHLFFHGKNESCPLSAAVEVNGWNESMDGTHCWQDSEFAGRMESKVGLGWDCDASNVAWIVNPRHCFPFARRVRPVETNRDFWMACQAAGFPIPVNALNLKK